MKYLLIIYSMISFTTALLAAPEAPQPLFTPEDLTPPANESPDRFIGEFLYMMTMLGVVLIILLAITWFLKKVLNTRLQQANTDNVIKVLERRPLTPKSSLYIIEVEGQSIVFAESNNGVTLLATFPVPEEEKRLESAPPTKFSTILEQPKNTPT